jgi:hypothetical protein
MVGGGIGVSLVSGGSGLITSVGCDQMRWRHDEGYLLVVVPSLLVVVGPSSLVVVGPSSLGVVEQHSYSKLCSCSVLLQAVLMFCTFSVLLELVVVVWWKNRVNKGAWSDVIRALIFP